MGFSRKHVVPAVLVLAVACGVAACGSTGTKSVSDSAGLASVPADDSNAPANITLRVADQGQQLQLPLQLSGEGAKAPVKVRYSNFLGAPAVFQAFQANAVDLGSVGDAGIIPPQEAGQSFVVVAAYQSAGSGWGIVVRPGQSVNTVAQLMGKKIGYAAGTAEQSYVLNVLNDNGLTTKDVTLVNLPLTSIPAALHSGDIDAAPTTDITTYQYESTNPGTKVLNSRTATVGLSYFVTTEKTLQDPAKSAAIRDYLQAYVRASNWVNSHESAYVTAYYGGVVKLPMGVTHAILADAAPTHFLQIDTATIGTQQRTTDLFTAAGAIPDHLDVSRNFSTGFNSAVKSAQ